MQQIVQDLRSGKVEVVELPEPVVRPGHVLVATRWSVISPGTEQAVTRTAGKSMLGKALDRPDQARRVLDKAMSDGIGAAVAAVRARLDDLLTPGYSSCGIVEAVGDGVEGLAVGQRVGCVGADVACHAERVLVPAGLCVPLPTGLEQRWGAFGALGAIAGHGMRLAGVEPGAVVAVVGLGLIGQIASQLVRSAGARSVVFDTVGERVRLATSLGAVSGATVGEEDEEAVVMAESGGLGADTVLITAASSDSAPLELAARIARDRATVCAVGDVGLSVPRAPFYEKELELRVSRSYGPGRYDPSYEVEGRDYPIGFVRWPERRLIAYFFDEVGAGRVELAPLVTHEFPIERGAEAYAALADPSRLAILISYGDGDGTRERRAKRSVVVERPGSRAGTRVGLIGPGQFARSTLLPILKGSSADIAAVSGLSPARSFGVARRFSAGYATADPSEIIADESINVVVVATRHDSHAELAAAALERGKAVLLEKPLCIDDAGYHRMEELLDERARLVIDFNRTFAPSFRRLAAHFERRSAPLYAHYRVNAGALDPGHWLMDPDKGGGRLVGEGCHFVDLCSALVGEAIAEARAVPLAGDGDSFTLELRYEDGSLATIAYVAGGDRRMPKEHLEVLGGGQAAILHDFRKLELYSGGRRRRGSGPRGQDKGHKALVSAALRFFAEGGEPPVPYERVLETTRLTLRARDALREGASGPFRP